MNLKARVGARIAELRQAAGYTQQELSTKSGLDSATLSKIETGKRNLTLETLQDLLSALDVSPKCFFGTADFETVPGVMKENAIGDSEAFVLEEGSSGLRVCFPCGRHVASALFPGMRKETVVKVVGSLRKALAQAEVGRDAVGDGEVAPATALMAHAVAECFLAIAHRYPRENPSDVWRYLVYRAFLDPLNHPPCNRGKDFDQSWKRTSGWALEQIVALHYGAFLQRHDITLTSYTSNREREPIIKLMGLTGTVIPDKVDQFLLGQRNGKCVPIGVIHMKSSVAERRTDDVPASRAVIEAGYVSLFVTMDCKDTPSEHPRNRGEYGEPGPRASDKRKDIENEGHFSAVFSFNSNTKESPSNTPSGCRIMRVDFSNPDDAFTKFIIRRWQQLQKSRSRRSRL
jgi:transcriptional regulator with XRE-family HTH domain